METLFSLIRTYIMLLTGYPKKGEDGYENK